MSPAGPPRAVIVIPAYEPTAKLDELVAARITLDEVNQGYDAMKKGTEARSVIVY